jgi:glycine dehydrogenase subunit 2
MKTMFRQAQWDEPVIFKLGGKGRRGYTLLDADGEGTELDVGTPELPATIKRTQLPKLPELSEVEVVRHFTRLSQMNYGVDLGFYPLGSCTMKYNPKINDVIAGTDGISELHPNQNEDTAQGILEILYTLSKWLAEITGTDEVCLQPSAGAHGELLGALIMRACHKFNGNCDHRTELIVPDSAHGTNPASGTMAGFKIVVVPSNQNGTVDLNALKTAVSENTAGLMLTNPNTLGIFEEDIAEIADIIHDAGGLLYYDGANLNAIIGKTRPGDMGYDIVHINIHKTFGTPHGGGGPGAGPIGVCKELAKFLPVPAVAYNSKVKRYFLDYSKPESVGKIRGFYGNIAVLLRAYAYILSLGREGLEEMAEISVLNANYLVRKLSEIRGFELPYAKGRPRKHECVFSLKQMTKETGVRAADVAKRLLDYGLHSPTTYFPLIVDEALMIEPTESMEKEELDRFIEALQSISGEAYSTPDLVKNAPYNAAVTRLDEVKASHPKTMALSWRMHQNRNVIKAAMSKV